MNCEDCIKSFYPDPRVKSGKHHLSSCDYCTIDYSLEDTGRLEEVYQRLTLISKKLSAQAERLVVQRRPPAKDDF